MDTVVLAEAEMCGDLGLGVRRVGANAVVVETNERFGLIG